LSSTAWIIITQEGLWRIQSYIFSLPWILWLSATVLQDLILRKLRKRLQARQIHNKWEFAASATCLSI
jgi:polyferredoxin